MKKQWHWHVWVKGLVSSLISGAAGGVASIAVVPTDVQAVHPHLVAKIAAISAVVGLANYLKQSPIPQEDP